MNNLLRFDIESCAIISNQVHIIAEWYTKGFKIE